MTSSLQICDKCKCEAHTTTDKDNIQYCAACWFTKITKGV